MQSKEDFVNAVQLAVCNGTAEAVFKLAAAPVGRGVKQEQRELANWIAGLSETDKIRIISLINEGVNASLFGVLCVLDGVRQIEGKGEKGKLELRYIGPDGSETKLNAEQGEYLHDCLTPVPKRPL